MSDYTKTTNFTAKDALNTGDPNKIVAGSDHDTEYDNIATAVATKYDSDNLASQAQAEAGTLNTVLMTPLRVQNVLDQNAGVLQDLSAMGDPGADSVIMWDESQNAAVPFSLGDGLTTSATVLSVVATIAGAGLTWASGVAAVGAGSGITVNANDVALTNQAATTDNVVDLSAGTFSLDFSALTNVETSALAATDEFIYETGGVQRAITVGAFGLRPQLAQGGQTLAAADMNTIMEFDGTATLTIDENATIDIPNGVPVVLVNDHATQFVTVQADTAVTLNSVFHPGGTANASDRVRPGGTAVLFQVADDDWYLTGDIAD